MEEPLYKENMHLELVWAFWKIISVDVQMSASNLQAGNSQIKSKIVDAKKWNMF